MDYPTICCLCPTYGRPKLLNNAVECFLRQDYPAEKRVLFIMDDLGTIRHTNILGYHKVALASTTRRYHSLPEKYNQMWRNMPVDLYVVWEDDDVQLPWCLKAHAAACEHHGWSYPSEVWSDYGGVLHTEPSGGRFHGSLAIRRETLKRLGGWPNTKAANFDQQFIANLKRDCEPGDPLLWSPSRPIYVTTTSNPANPHGGSPAYVFRYSTTGQPHGQTLMQGPDDETWYDRYLPPDPSGPHIITPGLDESAKWIWRQLVDPSER